ncbi:MAG TPA: tyrosine-type recombinase/integrase [Pyrinomonadaceae bacterium]|nr:tyrosine-type recombinase/integrase [Pyrinomonadaceae bacterium]
MSASAEVRTDCRRTRYLTFTEEGNLFEKLQGQEWVQRIVTMAINTGMRQGEIFNLTWFDVDLPRGVIHVRVSKNGQRPFRPGQSDGPRDVGRTTTHKRVYPSKSEDGWTGYRRKFRFDKEKSDAGIKTFVFQEWV